MELAYVGKEDGSLRKVIHYRDVTGIGGTTPMDTSRIHRNLFICELGNLSSLHIANVVPTFHINSKAGLKIGPKLSSL